MTRPCTSRPGGRVHPGLRGSRLNARYRGALCHQKRKEIILEKYRRSRKEGDNTGKVQTVKKGRR